MTAVKGSELKSLQVTDQGTLTAQDWEGRGDKRQAKKPQPCHILISHHLSLNALCKADGTNQPFLVLQLHCCEVCPLESCTLVSMGNQR